MNVLQFPKPDKLQSPYYVDEKGNYYCSRPLGTKYVSMNITGDIPHVALNTSLPKNISPVRHIPKLVERLDLVPKRGRPLGIIAQDEYIKILMLFTNVKIRSDRVLADSFFYQYIDTPDKIQFSVIKDFATDIKESVLDFIRNEYFPGEHTLDYAHGKGAIMSMFSRERDLVNEFKSHEQPELDELFD